MFIVDDHLLEELAAQRIDIVRLGFSDFTGAEKGKDFPVRRLAPTAFCRSVFGTSPRGDVVDIDGGRSAGFPDVLAVPDLSTLRPVPWQPGLAHVIADIVEPDGGPAEESPRHVLRRVLDRFGPLGLRPLVGPELEFFLLEPSTGGVYTTDDALLPWVRDLDAYGLDVAAANHEFAPGQFEINLWHSDPLDAADRAFRFRTAVRELASSDGNRATFMARPHNAEGGSGFHLHFSAAFGDPDDEDGLSATARSAVAGLLAHAPAIAALLCPTVNSYKRLGPGTLAPWLADWGLDNRSAMIRIPPERGDATRLELRLGDASANPYLAVAALLAAAYLGIRGKLDPPAKLTGYGYDPSALPACPRPCRRRSPR